jgi:hypothetical protein
VGSDRTGRACTEIALQVDGEVVATKSVAVGAGESTTVTFTHAFDAAGDYEIVVEDVTAGTLSVQAGDGTATPGPGTEGPGDGDGGIGTGLVVLLVLAVLAVAVAYLYRKGYFDGVGDDGRGDE